MPRAAVVELDDCLSKPINLLSVGKYSSTGRDSIWVVQEEVLCQGPFPRIFPGAGSPCPVPSMAKAPPFPRPSSLTLLAAGNVRMRGLRQRAGHWYGWWLSEDGSILWNDLF